MNKKLDYIGWLGTQLLAWCGLPAAIQVIDQGHANGYSIWFLLMWGLGEILCLIYTYHKYRDLPLFFNYSLNLVFISIICYYLLIS